MIIAVVGVILILVIAAIVYGFRSGRREAIDLTKNGSEDIITIEPETELEKDVTVDGVSITGMSREEAKEAILKNYPWAMTVTYQDDVYEVEDLMAVKVDELLEEIFTGEPKQSYTLDTSGLEEAVADQVLIMKNRWDKAPKNGSISSYDASSDSFSFAGEESGISIDGDRLESDILSALSSKNFNAKLTAVGETVQPEISAASAKEKYKTIGTYTTETTANSARNTNIRLACEALNGTIVQPGQEISFNDTVGERTEEKGYKGAAAYNNGEVVEEIGGGVCQVSTTLYNAAVKAGMNITMRRSHTFEPSYITPGQDATVSWGGPDFKFVNNSSAAVGIRASYYNQTCTVSIYGIPVLEDGVTQSLESTKLEEFDMAETIYEEDPTLAPGTQVVDTKGTKGSRWETRLIVKKDGVTISNDVDHTVTYKGHTPVIRINSSPAEETEAEESPEDTVEAVEEATTAGVGPGYTSTTAEAGPGVSTTAAATTAAVPADNVVETSPAEAVSSDQPVAVNDQIVAPKPAD